MPQASFSINKTFLWSEQLYRVVRIVDNTNFLIESTPNNQKHCTLNELLAAYNAGEIQCEVSDQRASNKQTTNNTSRSRRMLSDYSPKTQVASKRANKYLQLLLAEGPIVIDRFGLIEERIANAATTLNDENPPNKTTVYRWHRRFKESGEDINSLVLRFENRGGKGKRRCSPEVGAAEDRLIEQIYMTENRFPLRDVADQMQLEFRRENDWRIESQKLKPRSESSIHRRIKTLDQFEVVAAREGVQEAHRRFRFNGTVPSVHNLLEIVEIDQTPLDFFVIDSRLGIPKGRPTLTMGICRKSKMPWGFNIGFDDCSAESVLSCMAHGIKPKSYLNSLYPEVQGTWPVFGIPAAFRCDNGAEFHSRSISTACDDLKTNLTFSPKRRPNWKGSIESYLKTFNYSFIHKLPGTTLAKYWNRKAYDPLKCAIIDFDLLVRLVHTWIVDIYMLDMHRGLGRSPINAWKELDQ